MREDRYPYIPETVTVHLGKPDADAPNVTVPFVDYIKNVASSEIYPTWPENALRANIYAITTFALNRIYTKWYRSRGYDFDITNSTQCDQAFVRGQSIFETISNIADETFNDYVTKQGSAKPHFTQFCNGTTVTCNGLSQWGTVYLAEEGVPLYEILKHYYGDDINIVRNAPLQQATETYSGTPLRCGASGNNVKVMQQELNRIARNYPGIPKIPAENSVFDQHTENAVCTFQKIFDLPATGVVDKATWYKIKRYYAGVKKLGELMSKSITPEEEALPYPSKLSEGSKGVIVRIIQYYLTIIGYFNPDLNTVTIDGDFGPATVNAVRQLQRFYGLPVTGVVEEMTLAKLNKVYRDILGGVPNVHQGEKAKLYPGYFISEGAAGQDVTDLQTYLSCIGESHDELTVIPVTGYFGPQTRDAVFAFQDLFGLTQNDVVGPVTWSSIAQQYNMLISSGDD